MTADCVRGFSTNAREVEQLVRHRGVSGNQRRAGCAAQEVLARVRLYCDKFAIMRGLKDRGQPFAIRTLSPLDQIVVV
jgi:hypothetical protein